MLLKQFEIIAWIIRKSAKFAKKTNPDKIIISSTKVNLANIQQL